MRARDRRTYDHRLRELVFRTQDTSVVAHLAIPRSTLDDWLRHPPRPVVTLDERQQDVYRVVGYVQARQAAVHGVRQHHDKVMLVHPRNLGPAQRIMSTPRIGWGSLDFRRRMCADAASTPGKRRRNQEASKTFSMLSIRLQSVNEPFY